MFPILLSDTRHLRLADFLTFLGEADTVLSHTGQRIKNSINKLKLLTII